MTTLLEVKGPLVRGKSVQAVHTNVIRTGNRTGSVDPKNAKSDRTSKKQEIKTGRPKTT